MRCAILVFHCVIFFLQELQLSDLMTDSIGEILCTSGNPCFQQSPINKVRAKNDSANYLSLKHVKNMLDYHLYLLCNKPA